MTVNNPTMHTEQIIKQSPWLAAHKNIHEDVHLKRLNRFPLIYREKKFLNHPFTDGVYVVTGPRQIGKSTHIKLLIQQKITATNHQNFLYFNCDLLSSKQEIVALVENYLAQFPAGGRRYICLDEITSVKDSFLAIKYLIDSGHDNGITYLLSGSNTIGIKKTGEYLPGRRGKGIDFYFNPISFKQFIQLMYPALNLRIGLDAPEKDFVAVNQTTNLHQALEMYFKTGGFPRVINEYHLYQAIHEDLFTIYRAWITSEIAKADRKEHIAKLMLERALFSLGSEVSYQAFAQDAGIGSHNTVYDYLEFFSNAYILSVVYHFDIHQKAVRYRKNKKIYFNDPFVYAIIEGWLTGKPEQNYDYLQTPITRSRLAENVVFNHLAHTSDSVYFYRGAQEIDFVFRDYLVEVKYQNQIAATDYQYLSAQKAKKIVVTKNLFKQEGDTRLIPLPYFLMAELM